MIENFIKFLIDGYNINPFGQIVGIIAFCLSVYNFLFCKDRKFIIVMAIASFIWGVHFYSIGLLSASFINFVDIIKNILALKYSKSRKLTLLFVIFYILVGYLFFDGIISLIPTLTAVLSVFLVFFIRGIWLNIGFLFILILWGIYNYLGNSIGGLSSDIVLFISGIIGIIKHIYYSKKSSVKVKFGK